MARRSDSWIFDTNDNPEGLADLVGRQRYDDRPRGPRMRLCGICRQPGHRRETCPDKEQEIERLDAPQELGAELEHDDEPRRKPTPAELRHEARLEHIRERAIATGQAERARKAREPFEAAKPTITAHLGHGITATAEIGPGDTAKTVAKRLVKAIGKAAGNLCEHGYRCDVIAAGYASCPCAAEVGVARRGAR